MDVNLPRDKTTGKTKGFAFLMYEDQRSTVLAVDNLNGANVLGKTLRVDHVKNYKQPKVKGEDGEWEEPEEQSLNAKPEAVMGECAPFSTADRPQHVLPLQMKVQPMIQMHPRSFLSILRTLCGNTSWHRGKKKRP